MIENNIFSRFFLLHFLFDKVLQFLKEKMKKKSYFFVELHSYQRLQLTQSVISIYHGTLKTSSYLLIDTVVCSSIQMMVETKSQIVNLCKKKDK